MTRDERLAAGWVECWGLYDWSDGKWLLAEERWGYAPAKRWSGGFASARGKLIDRSWNCDTRIVTRRFWRRRKPKAPPPLQVGDEVVVRGKVTRVHYDTPRPQVCIDNGPGGSWFDVDSVERVKP